jgi:hypothetical protein
VRPHAGESRRVRDIDETKTSQLELAFAMIDVCGAAQAVAIRFYASDRSAIASPGRSSRWPVRRVLSDFFTEHISKRRRSAVKRRC